MNIPAVLMKIRPGAKWRMADTYANLVATWGDAEQTLPTVAEIEAAWLDVLKVKQWEVIKTTRDTLESASLPYMGKVLDFDGISQKRLEWATQNAQIAIMMGGTFTVEWTCADSSTLTMTAQDILGIPVAIAQRSNTVHVIARGLAGQIQAAQTAEELAAIVWPTT